MLSSLRLVKNIIKFPIDIILLMLVLKTCERMQEQRALNPSARPAGKPQTLRYIKPL